MRVPLHKAPCEPPTDSDALEKEDQSVPRGKNVASAKGRMDPTWKNSVSTRRVAPCGQAVQYTLLGLSDRMCPPSPLDQFNVWCAPGARKKKFLEFQGILTRKSSRFSKFLKISGGVKVWEARPSRRPSAGGWLFHQFFGEGGAGLERCLVPEHRRVDPDAALPKNRYMTPSVSSAGCVNGISATPRP